MRSCPKRHESKAGVGMGTTCRCDVKQLQDRLGELRDGIHVAAIGGVRERAVQTSNCSAAQAAKGRVGAFLSSFPAGKLS